MSVGSPTCIFLEPPLGAAAASAGTAAALSAAGASTGPQAAEFAALLRRWLGADLTILDVDAGRVLREGGDQLPWQLELLWEMCREVAMRRRPQFLADEDGLVILAIPAAEPESPLVAVGGFLTRPLENVRENQRLARAVAVDAETFWRWGSRQTPVAPPTLERLCSMLLEHQYQSGRIEQLEREVETLTGQLGAMHEEIRLLYRLTHNLNLGRSGDDLGRKALNWLLEIVPAQAIAVQFQPGFGQSLPRWERAGENVCGPEEFERLLTKLQLTECVRPAVVNRSSLHAAAGETPVRELIAVPLLVGERHFGWLAAFNHAQGGEFGKLEADLLTSASAILGIHSANTQLYDAQASALASFVRAMTSAIDAKDAYTCGHSERVARVAVRLAQELRCSSGVVEKLYLGGLLHDVGKIGIDDAIIRKTGRLTPEEFEQIKQHTQIGYNILADIKQLADVLPIVLHHHEAWDGSGYPHGLAGEAIPFMARIMAVADAFDAMQSDRLYRPGLPDGDLDSTFKAGAGTQWDARIVQAFFACRDEMRAIARSPLGPPPVNLVACFRQAL